MFRTLIAAAFLFGNLVLVQVFNLARQEEVTPDNVLRARLSEDVANAIRARDYSTAEKLLMAKIPGSSGSALLPVPGGVFFLDGKHSSCLSALERAKDASVDEPALTPSSEERRLSGRPSESRSVNAIPDIQGLFQVTGE
jgi:hypothetical protein